MVEENTMLEPYILVVSDEEVDKTVVDKVELDDVAFILMAAYFVYNIQYPAEVGCNNFFSFMEIFMY